MEKIDKFYDLIILGGGPAGLSAGIYGSRANLKVAIIDINMFGGQPTNYLEINNYPGIESIQGFELAEKFEKQALALGVETYPMQEIESVNLISDTKTIITKDFIFKGKSIIIATGASANKLGLENEEKYIGRGISYCAVCDAGFYKDKIVAIVGGGNSALEESLYLTKFAKKVYLIHHNETFRADKIIQDKVKVNNKIELILNTEIEDIIATDTVNGLKLKNCLSNTTSEINVDGLFIYIGRSPNVKEFSSQILLNDKGFIKTDLTMQTSQKGVFAIGDVRETPLRQVITAVSDGAIAAVYAEKYIDSLNKIII